jgi:hypothetical protein
MSEDTNIDQAGSEDFGIPEGYFDRSAFSIMNRIEWEKEHAEFPVIRSLRKENIFAAPHEYFEKQPLKFELLPFENLRKVAKLNCFEVPAGYFEESASVITGESQFKKYTFLSTVSRDIPFSVPGGYFETSSQKIKKTSLTERPAKVISIFGTRLAMAAAAALFIVTGMWMYQYYFTPAMVDQDCGTMACIDRTELLRNIDIENLDDDELLQLVNTKELERKLQSKEDPAGSKKKDTVDDISNEELLDEI